MPDQATTSTVLLTAIRAAGIPVHTGDAVQLLAADGRFCHPSTVRKRLRTLTRAGLLDRTTDVKGRCVYVLAAGEDGSS